VASVTGADATLDVQVGLAVRDSSVTIIAYCFASDRAFEQDPALAVHGRTLKSIGGALVSSHEGTTNYAYYPPTRPQHLQVVLDTAVLADLNFPPAVRADCPYRTHGPFKLVACQSLFLVAWASPLRFDSEYVELLDIDVWEPETQTHLGFFMIRVDDGPRGLVVLFGFQPPVGNRVELEVDHVYLRNPVTKQVIERTPNPPARATLTGNWS
jgi:hypothetical protein